ncbi:uncharacterized protein LOC144820294 [Lissotriton helveticus]
MHEDFGGQGICHLFCGAHVVKKDYLDDPCFIPKDCDPGLIAIQIRLRYNLPDKQTRAHHPRSTVPARNQQGIRKPDSTSRKTGNQQEREPEYKERSLSLFQAAAEEEEQELEHLHWSQTTAVKRTKGKQIGQEGEPRMQIIVSSLLTTLQDICVVEEDLNNLCSGFSPVNDYLKPANHGTPPHLEAAHNNIFIQRNLKTTPISMQVHHLPTIRFSQQRTTPLHIAPFLATTIHLSTVIILIITPTTTRILPTIQSTPVAQCLRPR